MERWEREQAAPCLFGARSPGEPRKEVEDIGNFPSVQGLNVKVSGVEENGGSVMRSGTRRMDRRGDRHLGALQSSECDEFP